jgi:hypothetical protein
MVSDVPSMDATVTLHEGLLNCEISLKVMGNQNARVKRIATSLEKGHFFKCFILSNGYIYAQVKSGGQCTGRDETSNFNTMTRARRAYAVNVWLESRGEKVDPFVMGAGDDCLEGPHPQKEEVYNMLGFPLRDAEETHDVEFCSHKWPVGGVPYGTRLYKAGFALLLHEPLTQEPVVGFIREFGGHPEFPALFQIISEHRPEMKLIIIEIMSQIREKESQAMKYLACKKTKAKSKAKKQPQVKAPVVNKSGRPNVGIRPAMSMQTNVVSKTNAKTLKGRLHEQVCSVTDPFCKGARMSKWPDGNNGASLAYQIRGHYPITNITAAAGNLVYVSGSLPYSFLVATSYAAGSYTMNSAFSTPSGSAPFISYAGTYRVTSYGIVIRNLLPAQTAQGYVTISKQGVMPSTGAVIASGDLFGSEVETHPLSAGFEVSVIGKPQAQARLFLNQDTTTTKNLGWDIIKVEIAGSVASATQTVDIEFFYNVEFTLNATNVGLHQFIPPAPVTSTKLAEAADATIGKLGSIATGGVEVVGSKVLSAVSTAVENIASDAFTWLFA